MKRPDCIRHWRELEGPDDATYPNNPERFSIGAPLALLHWAIAQHDLEQEA